MRKTFWVVAVVFVLNMAPRICFADPTDELADKILQDKDAAGIKEQLAALAKALDLPEEKDKQAQKQDEKQQPKTLTDVGERALQMAESMVTSTAATLEKYSPEVWRIMINQQYAKAMSALVVPLGLLLTALLWFLILRKTWRTEWQEEVPDPLAKNNKNVSGESAGSAPEKKSKMITHRISDEGKSARMWIVNILPGAVMVACSIFAAVAARNVIMYLVNPEYYAIRDLILLLLGKGQL